MDDANKSALIGLFRQALLAVGVLLAGHGIIGPNNTITPDNWQFIVGTLVTLAPIAWSWVDKIRAAQTTKEKEAIAVQAGINLIHEGAGILISDPVTGEQTPKPVTQETAAAIIKNFGPVTKPIDEVAETAALNRAQIRSG